MNGTFDIVGNIIDPSQHSGTVIGWLDNPEGRLSVGAFITAVIPLPSDPSLVVVPTAALVDSGGCANVFVERDPQTHEFEFRPIVVVTRGRLRTYVRAEPRPDQCVSGAQPLAIGERVVETGAVELAARLAKLQAASGTE